MTEQEQRQLGKNHTIGLISENMVQITKLYPNATIKLMTNSELPNKYNSKTFDKDQLKRKPHGSAHIRVQEKEPDDIETGKPGNWLTPKYIYVSSSIYIKKNIQLFSVRRDLISHIQKAISSGKVEDYEFMIFNGDTLIQVSFDEMLQFIEKNKLKDIYKNFKTHNSYFVPYETLLKCKVTKINNEKGGHTMCDPDSIKAEYLGNTQYSSYRQRNESIKTGIYSSDGHVIAKSCFKSCSEVYDYMTETMKVLPNISYKTLIRRVQTSTPIELTDGTFLKMSYHKEDVEDTLTGEKKISKTGMLVAKALSNDMTDVNKLDKAALQLTKMEIAAYMTQEDLDSDTDENDYLLCPIDAENFRKFALEDDQSTVSESVLSMIPNNILEDMMTEFKNNNNFLNKLKN